MASPTDSGTLHPMKRGIIIDGSWQDLDDQVPSNAHQVYRLIQTNVEDDVDIKYIPGVGTGWLRFTGGGFGLGVKKIVQDAYDYITKTYEPGDLIFLLGPSRGASCSRWVAGAITQFGIPKNRKPINVWKAWDVGLRTDPPEDRWFPHVDFLGPWDTVGAVGAPLAKRWFFAPKFPDNNIHPRVDGFFHILGLDEHRWAFSPTYAANVGPESQVWIPGNHGDVIGGSGNVRLSKISRLMMLLKWSHRPSFPFDNSFREFIVSELTNSIEDIEWPPTPTKSGFTSLPGTIDRIPDLGISQVVDTPDLLDAWITRNIQSSPSK